MAAVKAPVWLCAVADRVRVHADHRGAHLPAGDDDSRRARREHHHPPVVWFGFPMVWPRGYWSMVAAAETFAWGLEALWLRSMGVKRAMVWSFIANAASFGLGMLSRKYFGVP